MLYLLSTWCCNVTNPINNRTQFHLWVFFLVYCITRSQVCLCTESALAHSFSAWNCCSAFRSTMRLPPAQRWLVEKPWWTCKSWNRCKIDQNSLTPEIAGTHRAGHRATACPDMFGPRGERERGGERERDRDRDRVWERERVRERESERKMYYIII